MKKEILNYFLRKNNCDSALLISEVNRYWFTNFSSSLGYFIYCENNDKLLLDGRYFLLALNSDTIENVKNIELFKTDLYIELKKFIEKNNIKKLAVEADWLTVVQFDNLRKQLDNIELVPVNFEKIRMIKSSDEIKTLKKACEITNKVYLDILDWIKPGVTEIEVSDQVTKYFKNYGIDKLSFDTIVASGPLYGAMPHAKPTNRKIGPNDFVTLDMGCIYEGYCSDQTRTFAMSKQADKKLFEIYEIVKKAQQLGIEAIKPGVESGAIHQICYDYIASQGYEKNFIHSTGHGIGLQIHEQPYLGKNQNTILEPGMTVTVEPGIYVNGVGGVRIEDDILVTETGYEFLTINQDSIKIL